MTAETWTALNRHFAAAQPLDGPGRRAYLDALGQRKPELAARLAALLEADSDENFIVGAIEAGVDSLLAETPDPHVGMRFGPYLVQREIGRGGMGGVYLAERDDRSFEQRVAIKLLGHAFVGKDSVARFLRERQILANLSHPNIVTIHEVGEHDGVPYFSLEFVDGQSLAEITREHPLAGEQAACYIEAVARARYFGILTDSPPNPA